MKEAPKFEASFFALGRSNNIDDHDIIIRV